MAHFSIWWLNESDALNSANKIVMYLYTSTYINSLIVIIYFPNILGDTMLVVPIPSTDQGIDKYSGDLMSFLKYGQKNQQYALIQLFAKTALNLIETQQKLYISTHGHGLPWLHIRLSNLPKYYTHIKYLQ